ncbi:hypothetical protein CDAR_423081 [Caerostris darwini]|uniref:Transmembrane protein n=1 Tax=Caerostris darwini TaxID=1538125 RepID=A0AAV4TFK8_9ARAC|nr:hypothetical protein CDAR_423081 [Caerostris darwini]
MSGFPPTPSHATLGCFFHSPMAPGRASPLSSVCPPHILMHFLEARSHLTVCTAFFLPSSFAALGLLFSLLFLPPRIPLLLFLLLLRLSFSIGSLLRASGIRDKPPGLISWVTFRRRGRSTGRNAHKLLSAVRSPCVRLNL